MNDTALAPEVLRAYRKRWIDWADRAIEYLQEVRRQLVALGDSPVAKIDYQADETLRHWRQLSDRPENAWPYIGVFGVAALLDKPTPEPPVSRTAAQRSQAFYPRIFRFMLKWEGSHFTNDPADRGGPTRYGVIQRRYDQYRDEQKQPRRSVRDIDMAEVEEIYERYYWEPVWGSRLPPQLAAVQFDFGVNSGPSRSIKYLQWSLNLPQSGKMDERTLAAALAADQTHLVADLIAKRENFLRGIVRGNPSQSKFLRGWLNRTRDLRTFVRELEAA